MDSHSMVLIITPLEDIKLGSKIHVQNVKRCVGDFNVIINNKYIEMYVEEGDWSVYHEIWRKDPV
jgi:hypothetical protein